MTHALFKRKSLATRPVSCDLCGSDTPIPIAKRDRTGQPLITVGCTCCGMIYSNPMPTDEALAEYYAADYRAHYQGQSRPRQLHLLRGEKRAAERLALLREHVPDGATVLDIGAGAGEFVAALAKHGMTGRGIEPSRDFASFARSHYGADVRTGDWTTLDPAEGLVDAVTLHHVMEHLAQPTDVMLKIRSVLKDGGILYIAVPDISDTRRSPHARWHMGHVQNFAPATLDMLAQKTGFVPVGGSKTTRLYRKEALPESWAPDHVAGAAVIDAVRRHTTLRHFATLTPFRRFANRSLRHGAERFNSADPKTKRMGAAAALAATAAAFIAMVD